MIRDLVLNSRTRRRFYEDKKITAEQLRSLVNLARLSPSGGNFQAMKFMLVCTPEKNAQVYETLLWAAYFKDWEGPPPGERPAGYIIMLRDKNLSKQLSWDEGIFAQSIYLGAAEMGLGGCMIGNIKKDLLKEKLQISDGFEISLVIALGYPKEEVILETVGEAQNVRYWRDELGRHHVPKRTLEDLIVGEY